MEYLQNVSDNNQAEYTDIMQLYGKDVWNYSHFLTGNRDWAEEITQEVFLKAFRSLHLFRGDSSFKTWLFTITRNVAQDYKRKNERNHTVLLAELPTKETSPSAESVYFKMDAKASICKEVLTLPSKFRDVFVMDAKYEKSMEEIAAALHISVGTVKSRLYRARRKMSESLKKSGVCLK
jgi:RNA polymerase sigma-70 factor, ECF subfamily